MEKVNSGSSSAAVGKTLTLRFHGRILEHLGIQMYQSPVNALSELIANAWDADANKAEVSLPSELSETSVIIVKDDGIGMTFGDCQQRYLEVGWNRRSKDPDERSPAGRRILGRKGIGKFAGFGIADIISVDTTSKLNGERTVFELNLSELVSSGYVSTEGKPIKVIEYEPPDEGRRDSHGCIVTLTNLKLSRAPSEQTFARSMARRFLLYQQATDFRVLVNGNDLPDSFHLQEVEYSFPRDYMPKERPKLLEFIDESGWGTEKLKNGKKIDWRFLFYKETIDEEELRGVAIFSRGKVAQAPFAFLLSGGLGGQHGVEYLSGQVRADFIDDLTVDAIATDRQGVNWEFTETRPLLEWGQERTKSLLKIWHDRRGAERQRKLEEKLSGFVARLDKLQAHEARTVKKALLKIARISTLNDQQFEELGSSILTCWEQGRVRELIDRISQAEEMSEEELLHILLEAEVLTALNTAEAVKTKLLTVGGLVLRIQKHDLETAVRDYIANNPWLVSPLWETFRVEKSVAKLVSAAAGKAGLTRDDLKGRIDLVLASGNHLLILEFMRPGLPLNLDHLNRFDRYVRTIRVDLSANTGGRFSTATGYIIADGLEKDSVSLSRIKSMSQEDMFAMDWQTLFSEALARWEEFLETLVSRAPNDERLKVLLEVAH
jgi:hypothetical protein